jgi:hypothetical protein
MLQDMDNIEVRCVFYVKVSTFTHLEQSKIALLAGNESGIMMLTGQHDMIVSISFMSFTGDYLRQTSADILWLELHRINIQQLGDFSIHTLQLIQVVK